MPRAGSFKAVRLLSILSGAAIAGAVAIFAHSKISADDVRIDLPKHVDAVVESRPAAVNVSATTTASGVLPPPVPTVIETPTKPDDTAVLIARLKGPDADSAAVALLDRGTVAVDQLTAASLHNTDPQIRTRAATLVAEILDRDADGATSITAHLTDVSAATAWDTLARRSRCKINGLQTAFPDRKVNLDSDGDSFWSVMTDLCSQTGVSPTIDSPPDHTITLFPNHHNWLADTPHQIVGPFWIGIVGVDRRRTIALVAGATSEDIFNVRFVLYAEPKLSIAGVSDFLVESAIDDNGNALEPQPPRPAVVDKPTGHTVTGRLRYPSSPGKTIKEIHGKVVVLLAEGNQWLRVDNVLGKPVTENPIGGCAISAVVTKSSARMYQVKITCDRDAMDNERWRAMREGLDGLQLLDAAGKPLRGLPWTAGKENTPIHFEATATFAIDQCGEPASIAWEIASRFKPVEVPATFKSVPMP